MIRTGHRRLSNSSRCSSVRTKHGPSDQVATQERLFSIQASQPQVNFKLSYRQHLLLSLLVATSFYISFQALISEPRTTGVEKEIRNRTVKKVTFFFNIHFFPKKKKRAIYVLNIELTVGIYNFQNMVSTNHNMHYIC